jgi:hypothetical protein
MPVRGPLLVAVLTFLVPFSAANAQAQHDTTPTHHSASVAHPPYARVPYVLVPDSVRNWFADRWDDTSTTQMESGGCLTYRREVTRQDDTLYWVTSATDATPRYDSQRAIDFNCPHGSARWHSHTPTTCHSDMWGNVDYSSCVLGGVDAYSCQPSGNDRAKLNALGVPFGLIHCDRKALVPYFPARAGP